MEVTKTNDVIRITGRIDSNNAKEFEDKLFMSADGISSDIILEGNELEYISSAGLRVFLKLKKQTGKAVKLINVSNEIYDIFDVTGFTNLINVEKKLREISTENMEKIGEGGNGTVYRMDTDTIVKVYKEQNSPEKIKEERNTSRKAFLKGIPTAISYDFVKVDGYYGIVYEMIDAKTLAQVIGEEPDKLEYYAKECTKLLKQLHTTEFETGELSSAKNFCSYWIEIFKEYITEDEEKILCRVIESIPERNTFIHGDYHVSNIMLQNGELILIDTGDSALGHPIIDFIGMALVYIFARRNPESLYKIAHITPEQAEIFWNVFMKTYFNTDDDMLIKKYTDEIVYFANLKYMWGIVRTPVNIPPNIREMLIEQAKKTLLEGADREYSILKDI
ncbi:MAG: anti-sigma factor antagonist [Firmicutes bacterium]|nr:anti-sigma factor antagonist [Bacillota bacterium]